MPKVPPDAPSVPVPEPLRKESALIIGVILAALNALLTLIGAGGLDDGFQFNPDGILILTPILGALGIRQTVFSQETVDRMATRAEQRRAVNRS